MALPIIVIYRLVIVSTGSIYELMPKQRSQKAAANHFHFKCIYSRLDDNPKRRSASPTGKEIVFTEEQIDDSIRSENYRKIFPKWLRPSGVLLNERINLSTSPIFIFNGEGTNSSYIYQCILRKKISGGAVW